MRPSHCTSEEKTYYLGFSGELVAGREFRWGFVSCGDERSQRTLQCPRHDTAPERTWRHLDTMQFKTEIKAAVPRCKCKKCGVKTIAVPWASKHSRFTLMFEALAIKVLQTAANVKRAAALPGLSWDAVHSIIERTVDRGLERRKLDGIYHVGIDKKSFGKGQDYISQMTNSHAHRVLEVTEGRATDSCDRPWKTLNKEQQAKITAVSMDKWQAFISSAHKNVPQAEIVHDKFHVSKYLNEAVDKVRRRENQDLQADGDDRLKGTR